MGQFLRAPLSDGNILAPRPSPHNQVRLWRTKFDLPSAEGSLSRPGVGVQASDIRPTIQTLAAEPEFVSLDTDSS